MDGAPPPVDSGIECRQTMTMSDRDEVLRLNERFYEAFRTRDFDELDGLVAVDAPVAVVHPGWRALAGRDEVMASWRAIFRNPRAPEVRCELPVVFLMGDVAMVVCTEALPEGSLVATNLYVREGGGWRMSHHHAGPGEGVLPDPDEDDGAVLH